MRNNAKQIRFFVDFCCFGVCVTWSVRVTAGVTLRWGSAHNIWCDKTPCRNEKFPCTGPTRNAFGLGPYIFFVRSTNRSWNAPPTLSSFLVHIWMYKNYQNRCAHRFFALERNRARPSYWVCTYGLDLHNLLILCNRLSRHIFFTYTTYNGALFYNVNKKFGNAALQSIFKLCKSACF